MKLRLDFTLLLKNKCFIYVAADMLTVGFQSLYKYNTHDKQAQ